MTRLKTLILITMVSLILAACSDSDTARVADGEYAVSDVQGHTGTDLTDIQAVKLAVDQSNHSAVFTLLGGDQLSVYWTDSRWISGCPTMDGSTKLEVLEIVDATLLIGSMEFVNPVLAATCGSGIVLTEADSAVGASGPCNQTSDKCLSFQPIP